MTTSKLSPEDVELAERLVAANRILVDQGILDGFGHVSVRSAADPDRFLISRNLAPGLVGVDDVQVLDFDCETSDERPRYLETFIHAEVYRARPDAAAIVHSHSPSVIPFGIVREPLRPVFHMAGYLPSAAPVFEIRDVLGDGTDLLIRDAVAGRGLADSLGASSVVLMRGHGSTAVGSSIEEAVFRAVYAELNARAQITAGALGIAVYLTDDERHASTESTRAQIPRAWEYWKAQAEAALEVGRR